MNNRKMTGLIVLGLSVAAVPTLTAAHTHYTGKVPASIALDPMTVPPSTPVLKTATPSVTRMVSHKKKVLVHKKKAAVQHAAHAKRHKRSHKARAAV